MFSLNRSVSLLVLAAVGLGGAPPLAAQCRLCTTPATAHPNTPNSDDIQIRVETNLSFDRLIMAGAGSGAATIRPDGSSGAEGAVGGLGPRAMVGTVTVHGDAGRAVTVDLPRRIELYSLSGSRITLVDVASDAPAMPRLDAAGNLSFRFGGRLLLAGDADGQYRGDLPITVDYADDLSASAESLMRR